MTTNYYLIYSRVSETCVLLPIVAEFSNVKTAELVRKLGPLRKGCIMVNSEAAQKTVADLGFFRHLFEELKLSLG